MATPTDSKTEHAVPANGTTTAGTASQASATVPVAAIVTMPTESEAAVAAPAGSSSSPAAAAAAAVIDAPVDVADYQAPPCRYEAELKAALEVALEAVTKGRLEQVQCRIRVSCSRVFNIWLHCMR